MGGIAKGAGVNAAIVPLTVILVNQGKMDGDPRLKYLMLCMSGLLLLTTVWLIVQPTYVSSHS